MKKHISAQFASAITAGFKKIQKARAETNTLADRALHGAKRAIFALHRGDITHAQELLADAVKLLKKLEAVDEASLKGPVAAAFEECAEAHMTMLIAQRRAIEPLKGVRIGADTYIAALCDVVGEIVRMATAAAIVKDAAEVMRLHAAAQEIMELLYALDITGYVRQKFDQAKGHMRRLEHIVYELSLRT